jgi:hypothetical protein
VKNKNLIINHYNDDTYDHYDDLFHYLSYHNLVLSHIYGNIFDIFQFDPIHITRFFYKEYFDYHEITYAQMKYLCDCFLHNPIKTCFTSREYQGKLELSKGAKKKVACAISKNFYGHLLIVSKHKHGDTIITNENDLFCLLKMIDPSAETFSIQLSQSDSVIDIHYIEDSKTKNNWYHKDKKIEELFPLTKINPKTKVLLVNNAMHSINNLNTTHVIRPISNISDLEKLADEFKDYSHIIVCNTTKEISLEYLGFIQCDFFLKEKNRIGIADDMFVYNRYTDGITNKIPLP